jgi:hypothetical protein
LRHFRNFPKTTQLQAIGRQQLTLGVACGTSDAFYRREDQRSIIQTERNMKKDRKESVSSEPLGIIISRGDKTEPTPVFSAYIWGPVPDAIKDAATKAA